MNPVALYDALNCASLAALFAEGGEQGRAQEVLTDARLAAVSAFPAGSPEAAALDLILAAVGSVTPEMAA